VAAPNQPHAPVPQPELDTSEFRKQGIIAGLFGALLLAAWFLYLDTVRGNPLFTPTLLGTALTSGNVPAPENLRGSIPTTLFFTVVHAAVFALIGLGAAQFLIWFARVRSRALIVLLMWGALCIAFFAFALNVAVVGPNQIALRDMFLGNLLAAFGIAAYLARNLPREHPPG